MRRVLAVLLALAMPAGCGSGDPVPSGAGGSTAEATWRDPSGAGVLARGPGEPLTERTELAPPSRAGEELARFGVVADAHVRDEESPARAAFLDRLGGPFGPTFRPQEALAPHVLAGALRALRAQGARHVVEAGDLVDNAQANELGQALAVMRGGRVAPDSGGPGYTGVQAADNPDPFFYRPDVDPPVHRGLLAAAQRRFRSPGAGVPWLPVLGNHDWLVAGEVPPSPRLDALATGGWTVTDVDAERALAELGTPDADAVDRLLSRGLPGRQVRVPRDPGRRLLSRAEVVSRLREASGVGGAGEQLDYTADLGPRVRMVVLDTEAAQDTSGPLDDATRTASLTEAQTAWLDEQLRAAGDRWVIVTAHRRLEEAVLAQLAESPRVVAVLNGDTHRASIEPYRAGGRPGFWRIGTGSLADWPQQARMISLREAAGGGVVLSTWTVDADGDELVGTARELAYLDAQGGRPAGHAGERADRNARLHRGSA